MNTWLVKILNNWKEANTNLKHLVILMKDVLYFMRFPPIVLNFVSPTLFFIFCHAH